MSRFFNTAGPCRPDKHYMLSPEVRLPEVRRLVEREQYFVLHAPRQSGKTTTVRSLVEELGRSGEVAAVMASCETGSSSSGDVEMGVSGILHAVDQQAVALPEGWRPEPAERFTDTPPNSRLVSYLTAWCERCPRPVVLFLDEIDALRGDALVSVLRQLRSGYPDRPSRFPQSLALVGLRDVRDYRFDPDDPHSRLGTVSPFNIKAASLVLENFTAAEVAALVEQHTHDTGQPFDDEAKTLLWELSRGQPWLVNALAREIVDVVVPDRRIGIGASPVQRAKENLVLRRDTHIDSLVERLREPRVRRVIEPILAGEALSTEVLDDDLQLVVDLGLVSLESGHLQIANPIYREIIPRALGRQLQVSLPIAGEKFFDPEGQLDFDALLEGFRSFWLEHSETYLDKVPYSEAAAQLIFMAFLQKVVNGGGFVDREYAVGSGRLDLCIRWPREEGVERWAIELKVWRDRRPDPLPKGLDQLSSYLERLGLDSGTLVLFDARSAAPPLVEREGLETVEHRGRRIQILRL